MEKANSRKRHRNAGDDKQFNEDDDVSERELHQSKKRKHDGNVSTTTAHNGKDSMSFDEASENESSDDDDGQQKANSKNANIRTLTTKKTAYNLPTFSHVVQLMLPTIASISSSGTLSPAFFFFSILFLANEHNVILESVPTLDDLLVKGVVNIAVQK